MSSKIFYLSRQGEVSGPFSEDQFKHLRSTGEFYQYEWYWDGQAPDWLVIPKNKPNLPPLPTIKAAPPEFKETNNVTPSVSKEVTPPVFAGSSPTSTATPPTFKVSSTKFAAIAYDQRSILSGDLELKDQHSGVFTSFQPSKIPFGIGEIIALDCLNEKTDQSVKVKAKVLQTRSHQNLAVIDVSIESHLPLK